MYGVQKRKVAARTEPSNSRSGLHTANKVLSVLLLRAPTCKASVRRHFVKTRPGDLPTAKCELGCIACDVMLCVGAWVRGLITIFSGYIVIQCL